MPDLNLIDEGGFEESAEPTAPPAKKKSSKGDGGGRGILIGVLVLVLAAGGVYLLNKKGIIKLWGKKQQPIVQVQEEPLAEEPTEQAPPEQAPKAQKQVDTSEVALLETPPEEQPAKEAEAKEATAKKAKEEKKPGAKTEEANKTSATLAKLGEMKGVFTIQVVAYSEKKEAVEMAKRLEFSGYPSFVEEVPKKGGNLYTVRIGRYPSRGEAKKAVKTFAEQLQSRYFIDKIRTK